MGLLTHLKQRAYRPARWASREWHGLWRDRRLDALEAADTTLAPALARALRSAGAEPAGEAAEWRRRIEAERAEMLRSEEPIVDPRDAGAGGEKPGLTLAAACAVSVAPAAGMVLHHVLRETRPRVALELGTNVGISAAYQASALTSPGRLTTCEGMRGRLGAARALHDRLGLDNIDYELGPFQETLEPTLERIGPVEYALVDGHHQYEPTLRYFDLICGHAADAAVFVFDDIRWSSGMRRAWSAVRQDPRVETSIDLYWMGICVARRGSVARKHHAFVELWVHRGR